MFARMEAARSSGVSPGGDDGSPAEAISNRNGVDESEVRVDDSDERAEISAGQPPRGMPAPLQPTADEIAHGWLPLPRGGGRWLSIIRGDDVRWRRRYWLRDR